MTLPDGRQLVVAGRATAFLHRAQSGGADDYDLFEVELADGQKYQYIASSNDASKAEWLWLLLNPPRQPQFEPAFEQSLSGDEEDQEEDDDLNSNAGLAVATPPLLLAADETKKDDLDAASTTAGAASNSRSPSESFEQPAESNSSQTAAHLDDDIRLTSLSSSELSVEPSKNNPKGTGKREAEATDQDDDQNPTKKSKIAMTDNQIKEDNTETAKVTVKAGDDATMTEKLTTKNSTASSSASGSGVPKIFQTSKASGPPPVPKKGAAKKKAQ